MAQDPRLLEVFAQPLEIKFPDVKYASRFTAELYKNGYHTYLDSKGIDSATALSGKISLPRKFAIVHATFDGFIADDDLIAAVPGITSSNVAAQKSTATKSLIDDIATCKEAGFLGGRMWTFVEHFNYVAFAQKFRVTGIQVAVPDPSDTGHIRAERMFRGRKHLDQGNDLLVKLNEYYLKQEDSVHDVHKELEFQKSRWKVPQRLISRLRDIESDRIASLRQHIPRGPGEYIELGTYYPDLPDYRKFQDLAQAEQAALFDSQFEVWIDELLKRLHGFMNIPATISDPRTGPFIRWWFRRLCVSGYHLVVAPDMKHAAAKARGDKGSKSDRQPTKLKEEMMTALSVDNTEKKDEEDDWVELKALDCIRYHLEAAQGRPRHRGDEFST